MQRHLNKPRTADGVLQYAEISGWRTGICSRRRIACIVATESVDRRILVVGVEINVVAGNIEAGMVEDIECQQVVFQDVSISDRDVLGHAKIKAVLEGCSKDISSTRSIAVLECVAQPRDSIVAGNRGVVAGGASIRSNNCRNAKRIRVQYGLVAIHPGCSLQHGIRLCGAITANRNNRIGGQVVSAAPVDARGASAVIEDAVSLTTLQNGHSVQRPSVDDLSQKSIRDGSFRQVVVVVDGQYMRAVKV